MYISGYSYNDYNRTGGVLGAETSGAYWGSLGYRSSTNTNFGVYGSSAYSSGAGLLSNTGSAGVGGGFFGSMVGTVSRGQVIGQLNAGELFASYNLGDVYTQGKQVEIVETGNTRTAAYAVTSAELTVYNKGKINLVNGKATINFDENYRNLLGDAPVVTVSPMGACNGVYIAEVSKTGFTIVEMNNGNSNVQVSWIAVGDRVDAEHTVPAELLENNFDTNLKEALYDDSNLEGQGKGMWFDGSRIQFGVVPAELSPKAKPEGTQE